MAFQNHIKQVAPRLSQIKSRQPAMLLGNKVIVAGIGGNFIPGNTAASQSGTANIAAGYITISDSIITVHNVTAGTTSTTDKLYIADTGVEEPQYQGGGSITPVVSMDFYRCTSVNTSNNTWSGYKAVLNEQGYYQFQSQSTTGLAYSLRIPIRNLTFSTDALIQANLLTNEIPSENLIFYASLNGASPGTAETGQTITTNGNPTHQTIDGISCYYTGTNSDYFSFVLDNINNKPITFSIWLYANSFGSFWKYLDNSNSRPYQASSLSLYSGNPSYSVWDNAYHAGNVTLDTGKWHNVIFILNGGSSLFYIDGVAYSISDLSGITQNSILDNETWTIAHTTTTGGGWSNFVGYYSCLRIYDRVLSQTEISALATELTPTNS